MSYFIGLDLGGTNIKAGVVGEDKRVLAQRSIATEAPRGPEAVIDALAAAARGAAADAGLGLEQIAGIGLGAPGMLDLARGVVRAAPNLPGWTDIPVARRLAQLTGRPAVLENDANAAAFGEFWAGAGRSHPNLRHMVMLTLGTGIGSGFIVEGRLLHGAHDLAGEGGHLIVVPDGRPCACGQRGCLEAYASATHTARRAAEAIRAGEPSTLASRLEGGPEGLTAKDVFDAALAGDALARRIADQTATCLGIACVSFCRVLDPELIVFAGGMILAGEALFERVRAAFAEHHWRVVPSAVRIVPAELGNDAGFIGAAAVAWDARQSGRLGSGGAAAPG